MGKGEIGNEVTEGEGKLRYVPIFRFLVLVSSLFLLRVSNLVASKS